jgi:hypothetical protein
VVQVAKQNASESKYLVHYKELKMHALTRKCLQHANGSLDSFYLLDVTNINAGLAGN